MTTLVVGATGMLGGRICRMLSDRGQRVRALVREGSRNTEALRSTGISTVNGDLKDAASLDRACEGVTTVVTTANAVGARRPGDTFLNVDRTGHLSLLQSAKNAGASHFVYVSLTPRMPSANNMLVRCKREIEEAVRASGIGWTVLQPTAFMDVHLGEITGWDYRKGRGRILGSPSVVKSFIAVEDVAAFATAVSSLPKSTNRDLYLTGPEPLTAADALAIAERVTGRTFKVQRIPAPVLRFLGMMLAPVAPVPSSLMAMFASQIDDHADMTPLTREFGVRLTPFEEYVRQKSG